MRKAIVPGIFITLALAFMATPSSFAADATWLTDFARAKSLAEHRNKPILVNASGSDWCGWCIKLSREVFEKQAFQEFADDEFILFEADFPRHKEQSEQIQVQNDKLMEDYNIRGFPTVLVLDANGDVLARTGYRSGGACKYVRHLKSLLEQHASVGVGGLLQRILR